MSEQDKEALDDFFRDALNTELFGSEESVDEVDETEPDTEPGNVSLDDNDQSTEPVDGLQTVQASDSSELTVALPECIDIDNFDALRCQFADLPWAQLEKVTLDAEDLEDIGFAGMQLLSSVNKTCLSNDVKLIWENIPIPLFAISEELGMSAAIGF